ncbi:M56 family metallopeptidase [Humibacter ginsenosidimutans]|uniref:M56 family metallopeptidase n=1 Tax=Humibacter ginsenosidimutans TaxID=2599293 RepID=A0A5B8LZK6_9MICO|nr:M56 family metallopeptidase [Humibacter ginsenosidimutans]QDZ13797.1 M56 family metallopeptidase [Humibacter ginsenosidimutans]
MLAVAIALAVFAFALAWPVPVVLATAAWPRRMPGAALVLWQAIALAGGLSMIGSLLVFGLIPFGDDLPHAAGAFLADLVAGRLPADANFFEMFALAGAVLLGAHLLLNLVRTSWRAERQRRHHVQLLRLLSDPLPEQPGTRVIDHATPVAYCLPGAPRAVTVLSAGLLELLPDEELAAVVAHERAHVTQHHHVLQVAFSAWRSALPWFPIATRAHEAVGLLIELLADDQARRTVSERNLSRAVARVALAANGTGDGASSPVGPFSPVPATPAEWADARVARLTDVASTTAPALRLSVLACAVALVLVPTLMLLGPAVR